MLIIETTVLQFQMTLLAILYNYYQYWVNYSNIELIIQILVSYSNIWIINPNIGYRFSILKLKNFVLRFKNPILRFTCHRLEILK